MRGNRLAEERLKQELEQGSDIASIIGAVNTRLAWHNPIKPTSQKCDAIRYAISNVMMY